MLLEHLDMVPFTKAIGRPTQSWIVGGFPKNVVLLELFAILVSLELWGGKFLESLFVVPF